MKMIERVLDTSIRRMVNIDAMQLGFLPGQGTSDANFIIRQLQEKHIAANKPIYIAFVDIEKAFDREYLGRSFGGHLGSLFVEE